MPDSRRAPIARNSSTTRQNRRLPGAESARNEAGKVGCAASTWYAVLLPVVAHVFDDVIGHDDIERLVLEWKHDIADDVETIALGHLAAVGHIHGIDIEPMHRMACEVVADAA